MPTKKQRRKTVSMRPDVYDALRRLADDRGIGLARLVDDLGCRELAGVGVHIKSYISPTIGGRKIPTPEPRMKPSDEPVEVSPVMARALAGFNRDRASGVRPSDPR